MENQDDAFAALAQSFVQKARAIKHVSSGPYTHIAANGNTSIANVTALESVVVNTAGSAWTLTVYDGTSAAGAVIAVINASNQGNFLYHDVVPASGNIFVVAAGTTPGDATVSTI